MAVITPSEWGETMKNLQQYSHFNSQRIFTTREAIGLLRKELMETLGENRARSFLFRYGWRIGASDAREAMKVNTSIDYLIKQASLLHISTGHIREHYSERRIETSNSKKIKAITAKGKWIDSFEAKEHLKHHGLSDKPVCHILTGYASGYMSTIFNTQIFVKETHCVAKGDPECLYEMKYIADWGERIDEELGYLQEKPIVEELEYTYEQLLCERNYIEKVFKFHRILTERVSEGSNLIELTEIVHDLLGIPVAIEDLSFHPIAYSGLSETEYDHAMVEFLEILKSQYPQKQKPSMFKKTKKFVGEKRIRLITPIYVQNTILGYCSFIYQDEQQERSENDSMFLERFANAASLILLKEKTSFELIEKLKGNFLEQLLKGEIRSQEEIIKRGRYMELDLTKPYYIAAIQIIENSWLKTEEYLPEQTIDRLSKFLDIQGVRALVGAYEKSVVLLFNHDQVSKEQILQFLEKIYRHLRNTGHIDYKIGLSEQGEDIARIREYLEQALIAVRLAKTPIHDFASLNILGVLLSSKNEAIIKNIAKRELGELFTEQDLRNRELLKTLYVFLANGGNLQQTMDELALSLSGLMYRKNKLEKMLGKDLRNPAEGYQLLLLLDSLIAMDLLRI